MAGRTFGVVEKNGRRGPSVAADEDRVARLVALGRALSDPIRVKMLGMMAEAASSGRGCCGLPDLGVPTWETDGPSGICVCEFQDVFSMGQSKVSYHVRKLKEAGLILEERRGRWSFYSLDREAAGALLAEASGHLGAGTGVPETEV
ncbi:metalloregulator ArsR/SmtB family transcription factor (plasmid) [Rubrobacter tropicus]|uniref:Metalloregulator ArsR/SmtB family transcription factor n=1 Tax=Rubrobacter tropicus TaxID=2653851 RepID=A0A6G8QG14_9ACTN|nr:metalloregulator ArsR/SmtB family transcription factor [Rubrobacter tropicus]QIN85410.1 metalloregulator ArsR/SmtB family transcription factor [Rubrobacter tropicus]